MRPRELRRAAENQAEFRKQIVRSVVVREYREMSAECRVQGAE